MSTVGGNGMQNDWDFLEDKWEVEVESVYCDDRKYEYLFYDEKSINFEQFCFFRISCAK